MPLKIESIAHDKLIWNLKSDVIRFDRLDATVGLIKQRADLNRSRIPALQQFDKTCQSPPVSMMSSTIKTFLPLTETSRSLMILTSPEETVLFP